MVDYHHYSELFEVLLWDSIVLLFETLHDEQEKLGGPVATISYQTQR